MSEREPDPETAIPNDDPRCHCALEPGEMPEGAVMLGGILPGDGIYLADGQQFRIAMHADCPHHGPVLRQMQSSALAGGFSNGTRWAAT